MSFITGLNVFSSILGNCSLSVTSSNLVQAHDAATVKYDEAMNVKLLLREICQFLDTGRDPGYTDSGREQLKNLASKVTTYGIKIHFVNEQY